MPAASQIARAADWERDGDMPSQKPAQWMDVKPSAGAGPPRRTCDCYLGAAINGRFQLAGRRRQVMPSDSSGERRASVSDSLEKTSFSSISATSAAQEAAHARVAEAVRGARLAGYKSPLRRLIERLLPRRPKHDS
jgi:hypothetical protein